MATIAEGSDKMTEEKEDTTEKEEGLAQFEENGFIALPEEDLGKEEDPDKKEDPDDGGEKKTTPIFEPTPIKEPETKAKEETFEEIVHRGQVHRVTKEKLKELAQKGFDYDTKVGAHGKIARMIETDPEFAKIVNNAWAEKNRPKKLQVKTIDDYESEDDWLRDNLQTIVGDTVAAQVNTMIQSQPPPPPAQTSTVAQTLMARDPQGFNTTMSVLPQYLQKLSIENYRRIDTDFSALCEFYDYVKGAEGQKTPVKSNTPSFKVRSGSPAMKTKDTDLNYAWNLSNKDFNKEIAQIKGYT